jgi:hypothetical protein
MGNVLRDDFDEIFNKSKEWLINNYNNIKSFDYSMLCITIITLCQYLYTYCCKLDGMHGDKNNVQVSRYRISELLGNDNNARVADLVIVCRNSICHKLFTDECNRSVYDIKSNIDDVLTLMDSIGLKPDSNSNNLVLDAISRMRG